MGLTQKYGCERFGYIFAILAAIMFGSVSTMAKPLVSTVNPLLLSSMIYLIAAATLTPLAQKQSFPASKKNYLLILAISLCGATIAPSLFFVGLTHASASDAALIANGEVFFSVLLAIAFFKERLGKIGYVATALILAGMIIVTTDLNFSDFTLEQLHYQDMLLILSMLFWGIDNNLSRILAQKINVAKIAQIKSATGGAILFGIAVFGFGVPLNVQISQIPPILVLGIVGFAASLYFFMQSLKRINTVRTVLIFSMSSVFGLAAASIFLQEQVSWYQILAAGIMIFGVYLMNRKESAINPV
ncbi:DMT family transporter [Candidatus Nitrosotenuis sp. DW1]|uniref:DMT family transporter n=1 Tax=Candidatus Nitrosotenuis sp. DW1 TaxID=2259672 RepID=UPI0015C8EE06|nr:DMT family transporter [Candidatus Nitrosotenuis sp. DW1]QLH09174.1 EamA/RhaT family transporter [Candidatus Nitrosotenuis sp. DW1]